MMQRLRARLPAAVAVLTLACSAGTLALAVINRRTIHSFDAADPIGIVLPIGFAIVGSIVARHHPRNAVGWLFLFIAADQALAALADQYAREALITAPGSLPAGVWVLWAISWMQAFVYPAGAATFLLLLLPTGHLPSRRWRPIAALGALLTAIYVIPTGALAPGSMSVSGSDLPGVPNPVGLPALNVLSYQGGSLAWVSAVLYIVGLGLIVVAAAAPFMRMRRARGDDREQLKWIAYAVFVSAFVSSATGVLTWVVPLLPSVAWLSTASVIAGFGIALPGASLVAILKLRLYDIDIIISRTIVYGALAVLITAVYVAIAVGIGALAGGGGKPNLGLSILATAVVAVGFQPVRARLNKLGNRLVYGRRFTPYEVLSDFSAHAAGSFAYADALPRMAQVLSDGVGAESAVVWLRSGGELRVAAVHPPAHAAESALPIASDTMPDVPDATLAAAVRHQGELLGAISIVKRRGEPLTPIEEKLVHDLAQQAGLMFKNVGLTAALEARLEDLRASRQRLVTAQDEERRRLERNLHDGAQQHLVALKVKLALAEMLVRNDTDKAVAALEQLKGDADEALQTLRDLARGIYPPLLADKGLAVALESQARKSPVPVSIDADGVGRHPQEVEAALYFCCLEALQNMQKYAEASRGEVVLRCVDGAITLDISDDGRGFAPDQARGSGLQNIADRIDALGGSLTIDASPGTGTRLHIGVPLAVSE